MLERYAKDGFAPFAAEWQRRHAYQGKPVQLLLPDGAASRARSPASTRAARWCWPTDRGARASCPARSRCGVRGDRRG